MIRIHSDIAAGLQEFEWAFQIYKELDDQFYMTILLNRIGFCQEDPSSFLDFTHQSLALALETGNDYEAVRPETNLGGMSNAMGDSISGEQFFHQALARAKRIGKPSSDNFISTNLAFVGFLRGDLDQVKRYLPPQDNMVIGKVIPNSIANYLNTRALLAATSGDLEMSEQLARSLDFPDLSAHWALAMVYIGRGNLADASQLLSVEYQKPSIKWYPGIMTRSLPVAALILNKRDQPTRAAQVLSLATNHPASQVGWVRLWKSGANLHSELGQTLGEVAFQEAWEQGKSLDLAETVVQLASELSTERP